MSLIDIDVRVAFSMVLVLALVAVVAYFAWTLVPYRNPRLFAVIKQYVSVDSIRDNTYSVTTAVQVRRQSKMLSSGEHISTEWVTREDGLSESAVVVAKEIQLVEAEKHRLKLEQFLQTRPNTPLLGDE